VVVVVVAHGLAGHHLLLAAQAAEIKASLEAQHGMMPHRINPIDQAVEEELKSLAAALVQTQEQVSLVQAELQVLVIIVFHRVAVAVGGLAVGEELKAAAQVVAAQVISMQPE